MAWALMDAHHVDPAVSSQRAAWCTRTGTHPRPCPAGKAVDTPHPPCRASPSVFWTLDLLFHCPLGVMVTGPVQLSCKSFMDVARTSL